MYPDAHLYLYRAELAERERRDRHRQGVGTRRRSRGRSRDLLGFLRGNPHTALALGGPRHVRPRRS